VVATGATHRASGDGRSPPETLTSLSAAVAHGDGPRRRGHSVSCRASPSIMGQVVRLGLPLSSPRKAGGPKSTKDVGGAEAFRALGSV